MQKVVLRLTVEGNVTDFLGVDITINPQDGTIHMNQRHLINEILKELKLNKDDVKSLDIPMSSSKILTRHDSSPPFDGHYKYRRIIGMLNYPERCTRPDISYTVHQCARVCESPKAEHGKAIKWLGRYLHGTRTKGIISKTATDQQHDFEVFVDADFSGNWKAEDAE